MIIQLTQSNTKEVLEKTIKVLLSGGLVIFPSDTVYGALVDATNEIAVKKLIAFKNRPPGKPISVFVSGVEMLKELITVSYSQGKILARVLPGPFTVILDSAHKASSLLESEKGTLGVRFADYPFVTELVERFGRPVTATSANLSGRHPHYSIESLLKEFPEKKKALIDLVIDAGKLPRNKPSTIIDLTSSQIKVLRQGDIVFTSTETFQSETPGQTQKIAQFLFKKIEMHLKNKPVVFIIKGDLGVGKTIFVKGIAEYLGIHDVISPTFVIYYEYDIPGKKEKLIHFDLYQIEEAEEFKHLGIEKMFVPGNVICMEWGEKAGSILGLLKNNAHIVEVSLEYVDENKRKIIINE
ncbi:MAG: L-threonylcarbamoyladenylate synthase [bacterium]|nr:L-threonylcarbamoyladenylate synthase [bacterium]